MKTPLIVWCFTMVLFLELNYSSASFNVTGSELLNVILENSTYFDKELNSIRNISSESLFFNNNDDNISFNTNEECRTGSCERKLNLSSSASSSSSSKILWNFVSIPKSTSEHSISETDEGEGYSSSSEVPRSSNHYDNQSSIHNSSLHSNDNELDSKIDFDIDYVLHSGGDTTDYSTSFESYLKNVTTTESKRMTTEVTPFGVNSTNSNESGEDYTVLMHSVNFENLTEYSSTLAPQSTLISSDDELDFTTYHSSSFDSNERELSTEEINSHLSKIYSVETSDSEENTTLYSVHYDRGNKTTIFIDVKTPTESKVHESQDNLSTNTAESDTSNFNFESSTTEMALSEKISISNSDDTYYNTPISRSFKISSETEIPVSTDATVDLISVISTQSSLNTLLWTKEEMSSVENVSETDQESLNSMETSLQTNLSVTETTVKTELDVNFNIAENYFTPSTENGLYMSSQISEVTGETSSITDKLLFVENTSGVTINSTEADKFPILSQESAPTSHSNDHSTVEDVTETYKSDDSTSTGNFSESSNPIYSHDVPLSETLTEDISSITSTESDGFNKENILSNLSDQNSTFLPPYVNEDINEVYLMSTVMAPTDASYHSHNLTKIDNYLPSIQTNHDKTSLHSNTVETSTPYSQTSSSSSTPVSVPENSYVVKIGATSESSNFFNLTEKDIGSIAAEENIVITTKHVGEHSNFSVFISPEMENTGVASSMSTTMEVVGSVPVSVRVNDVNIEITQTPTDEYHFSEFTSGITKDNSERTGNSFEAKTESSLSKSYVDTTSAATDLDAVHLPSTGIEATTVLFSSSDEMSIVATAETRRGGKHIPFSSTLAKSTTVHPIMHNGTINVVSNQPEPTATEKTFSYFLYNRIKAEELTPEERLNIIETFIKLPDKSYTSEELNEKILIVHLWLLHAIADEYKNNTLQSLSESGDKEVEFENLPQILYLEPSPKINSPNISLTFIVNNKWRNETFAVDVIVTILNLHTEDLKHLVEIEEIYIYHNVAVDNKDLFSVIVAKYGIVLLSTCVITVIMILLLICVVIYYRRKNRHSAHCLTDDKLHRNMQEAMGIDLNPAVIILQDEIREKAALNGNKINSLDDDEGWLAPIGDVPVAEDNSSPFVQDTKL